VVGFHGAGSQKLLKKIKSQADHSDTAAPKHAETERTRLLHIVGKYNMSDADLDTLIKWRHEA
jgi:hypothetical protein